MTRWVRPVEVSLSQAWTDIQSIKDEITKLLTPIRYDIDLALKAISSANRSLGAEYSKFGVAVPPPARGAWHQAKGIASAVELILVTVIAENNSNLTLTPQSLDRLKEIRVSLTDTQMVIHASRSTVRDEVAHKIFEVL